MFPLLVLRAAAALGSGQVAGPPDAGEAATAPPAQTPRLDDQSDGGAVPSWTPPRLTHFEEPVYPIEDQAKGLEGDVVLRLTVDTQGAVTEAQVLSTPSLTLSVAAQEAARKFRFSPAKNGELPEASVVRYTLRFQIQPQVTEVGPPGPSPRAPPQAPGDLPRYATQVTTQAVTSAASAESVYDQDLQQRIIRTPADLLRSVPGLFTAQAQGGGKADQYFLRGFDADHGTDINFSMDGLPLNLPSNGHGQGYTDVHFVIPETIDRLEFSKGPYFADKGDFDTAGAVELHTRRDFAENELQGLYGQFQTYRVLGIGTTGTGPNAGWVAAEVYGSNGPFTNPEGLQRYSVTGKQNLRLADHLQLTLEAVAYASQWASSGLIPPRGIAEGAFGLYGSADPSEGGSTQRQSLSATFKSEPSADERFTLTTYLVRFEMKLYNDFTGFLTDPLNGDLVAQSDDRFYTGLDARYHRTLHLGAASFTTTLGAGGRFDTLNASLFHVDSQHQPLPTCYGEPLFCDDVDIGQSNLFAFVEENARLTRWARVVLGARGDLFTWNVTDRRAAPLPDALPTTGLVQRSIVDPKLAVILSPLRDLDLYLDAGSGFHSNDARAIVASGGIGALPRAWGAELGSRVNLFDRLQLSAALWFLYLDQEVTFDPDIDTTVPNPPSRRYGLDFSGRWDLYRHWLFADVDFTVDHVQYTTTADGALTLSGLEVPLAPTETLTAGLSALLPFGLRARLSLRQIDDHPANNDGTQVARGYAQLDFNAAYRFRFLEFGLSVENLLNTAWYQGQFDYVSRLPGEPRGGVDETNFAPGNPFNVLGSVSVFF